MVVIDHNKNIQRIVDVILADTNLYDSGKTKGKLRDVVFGDPENNDKMSAPQLPYLFVTTRTNQISSRRELGIALAENQRQIVVEYELVIVASTNSKSVDTQKQMYDIIKNLNTMIENDPLFLKPVTNDDAIFTRSIMAEVPTDEKMRGKLLTSAAIILLATIGQSYTINFPTIGDVILLSTPSNPDGIFFDDDKEQDGTRTVTPNGDFGNFFGEYESTFALDAAFRAKYGVEENITIKRGSDERIIKVVYIEINPTHSYDSIERSILHLEIVK